jgi:hypothetical protein
MTEDMATYEAALKDMRRDCDTCARPTPGTQVCPMPSMDIYTCLGNPSRPFWRPQPGSSSRPRENDVVSICCESCVFDQTTCRVGCDNCAQNGFMFWRPKGMSRQVTPLSQTQDMIREECNGVRELLLEKNRKYGDSAINPVRIFSKADPVEQINVRIDDKLSRIKSAQDDDTEDPELDLIGYLILKRVAKRRSSK